MSPTSLLYETPKIKTFKFSNDEILNDDLKN